MNEKLIVCHFTLEELEYINLVMVRQDTLTSHVRESLKNLNSLGVELNYISAPVPLVGKLLSYIKKGQQK